MTTYYVSQSLGSDANDGIGAPWQTLAKVNGAALVPGDQVLFRRGDTWHEWLRPTLSGTADTPITFGAYDTGDPPTIDGDWARNVCILGSAAHYLVIDGIRCIGWKDHGIYAQSSAGWLIQNNIVEDGGTNAAPDHNIRVDIAPGEPLLDDVRILNNVLGANGNANSNEAGRTGMFVAGVRRAEIRGNTVRTRHCKGITLMGNLNQFNEDVLIEENDIAESYGPDITVSYAKRTTVFGNHCHHSIGGGIHPSWYSEDTEVCWNYIHDHSMDAASQSYNGIDINHQTQRGRIHHNTIAGVPRYSVMIDGESVDWEITDNILDATTNDGTGVTDGRALPFGNRDERGNRNLRFERNVMWTHPDWPYVASQGQGDGGLYSADEWHGVNMTRNRSYHG